MATSFTIGAAMRKENVTPRGTPASTKPMKSGTAEHEQNGVTTAESGSRDVADTFSAAAEQFPRALGREERPDDAHQEDDARKEQQDLRGVVEEEVDGAAKVAVSGKTEEIVRQGVGQRMEGRIGSRPGEGQQRQTRHQPEGGLPAPLPSKLCRAATQLPDPPPEPL